MKRYIILAVLSVVLSLNINAQICNYSESTNDGFFVSDYDLEYRALSDEWDYMPRMIGHGLETHQDAPLGSGLLLLGAFGLGYVVKKRNSKRK